MLNRAVRFAPASKGEMPSLDKLDTLNVVGKCLCGCASVDFRQLKSGQVAELVADAIGETSKGERVEILVFALDGDFVSLEIVGYSNDPAPLPVASTVRGWDGIESEDAAQLINQADR